jgi:hypothetical protein
MLITTAFAFGAWGLFFSALMKRTLGASVMTYAFALFAVLGLPLIMIVFLPFYSLTYYGSSGATPNPILQAVFIYAFGLLVILNPLATGFITEMYLTSDHTFLFVNSQRLSNGTIVPLISPWLPYVLVCLFSSLILILITIQLVHRKESS